MSLSIANQVKTLVYVLFQLNCLLLSLLLCQYSHLTDIIIIITITACSTQLFAILLAIGTVSSQRNFTQGWLNSSWLFPLCLALLYKHVFSLPNVLIVVGSWTRLLENSIAKACVWAFSYLSVLQACCCWFMCKVSEIFVRVYLSIVYTQTLVAFSITFILLALVFLAFAYGFQCKRYEVVS